LRIELLHRQIEAELEEEITELKTKAEADRRKFDFPEYSGKSNSNTRWKKNGGFFASQ
jgi:hypothetical protein